jgi:signal transduction histidine kinase
VTSHLRYLSQPPSGIPPGTTEERALLASLVHEINNPLDSLLNLLYILESEAALTEEGRVHLALAREEVRRISQIAHQGLDRFRDATHPQEANVPRLLDSVLELYKSRLESHGITVYARYCRNANLRVYAGPLRQIFSNLLLNAADAIHSGGTVHVRVAASHEWTGEKRSGLRVTFADNGCGIPNEDLSRISQPFFTTKGPEGNGLGLALVSDVVHKHQGVLRVRSTTRPGRNGTVFTVFLPAA